jgi:hypothetical protein
MAHADDPRLRAVLARVHDDYRESELAGERVQLQAYPLRAVGVVSEPTEHAP